MSSSPAGPVGDGPRFAVVGAYVIDCIARTDRMPEWGESYQGESVHMAPGGKALNMAVALARMGAHVDAIGVVGDDLAGQTVVDALVREGVGTEGLEVRPGGRTPTCVCLSRTDGETAFLWRIDESVATDASTIHGVGKAPLVAADATIVTFESPTAVSDAITLAKHHGRLVVVNPAPPTSSVDLTSTPWPDVDVLVPNAREAMWLIDTIEGHQNTSRGDDLARAASIATGVETAVVTLGSGGVIYSGPGGDGRRSAPGVSAVVDTTGASDAFVGMLTFKLVSGCHLRDAIDAAQEWAVAAISNEGGSASMPANTHS